MGEETLRALTSDAYADANLRVPQPKAKRSVDSVKPISRFAAKTAAPSCSYKSHSKVVGAKFRLWQLICRLLRDADLYLELQTSTLQSQHFSAAIFREWRRPPVIY